MNEPLRRPSRRPAPRRTLLAAAPAALALLAACDAGTDGPAPADGGKGSDGGGAGSSDAASSPSPTRDPVRARADALSIEQAAGQLVLVAVPAGSTLGDAIAAHGVGGIFLLGVWESADAVRAVIQQARDASAGDAPTGGIPPLVAVDQEGGQVRMLRGDAAQRTASAQRLGEEGSDAVAAAYRQIGRDLADLGIGVDLAPVADVVDEALGDANSPVGGLDRGFGTDPEGVAACVRSATRALTAAGVGATLKHFPGLGRVRENTDHSARGIRDDQTTADDPFLEPFRAGIEAGAGIVMLSSATYTRIDADSPAMFSRAVVTDVLRGDLGFEGLVVTDDIGEAKAVQSVPVAERATRLLEAGGDAVLTADPALAGALTSAILEWAGRSPENEQRVRESATRMLRVKDSLGLLDL